MGGTRSGIVRQRLQNDLPGRTLGRRTDDDVVEVRPCGRGITAIHTAAILALDAVGLPTSLADAPVPDDADVRFVDERLRQQAERRELTAPDDDELTDAWWVSGSLTRVLRRHGYLA